MDNLGDGNMTRRALPVQVKGLTDIIAVAGGKKFSLALKSNGTVWAWGNNGVGHLGNDTRFASNVPVQVHDPSDPTSFLSSVTAIAAGGESAYALKNGVVMSWGSDSLGQLGRGDGVNHSSVPLPVSNLSSVTAIAAGGDHAVALVDSHLWAWGNNNQGQLGDDTTVKRTLPTLLSSGVADTGTFSSVTAGRHHNLAIVDGFAPTIASWGWNSTGQLGDNTTDTSLWTIKVRNSSDTESLAGCTKITAGTNHSLGLYALDGSVWGWGQNYYGQLGNDNSHENRLLPVKAVTNTNLLTGVADIAAGGYHSLALKQDGSVLSWGLNTSNQLGNDHVGNYVAGAMVYRDRAYPVLSSDGTSFLSSVNGIAAGDSHSLAIKTDGTVWAWGSNYDGQLGDGTRQYTPVIVKDLVLRKSKIMLLCLPATIAKPAN